MAFKCPFQPKPFCAPVQHQSSAGLMLGNDAGTWFLAVVPFSDGPREDWVKPASNRQCAQGETGEEHGFQFRQMGKCQHFAAHSLLRNKGMSWRSLHVGALWAVSVLVLCKTGKLLQLLALSLDKTQILHCSMSTSFEVKANFVHYWVGHIHLFTCKFSLPFIQCWLALIGL